MTFDEWLRQTFIVVKDGWYDGEGGYSDSFIFNVNGQQRQASIVWFESIFGFVALPPTDTALKSVDTTDKYGWNANFDAWKSSGLIS